MESSSPELNSIIREVVQKLQCEIASLEAENQRLQSILQELGYQEGQARFLAIEWQQKRQMIKDLLAKIEAKEKGYQTRNFSRGIEDLRDLIG